jgi:hypothetical protein
VTPDGSHVSLHDRRIKLIVDALRDEPEDVDTVMSEDAAHRLAVRVLDALDYLPGATRRPPVVAAADGPADPDLLDMETCPACPHPVAAHDAIGTRFCRITVTRAMSRGCSCSGR